VASDFNGLMFTVLGEAKFILVLQGYMGSTSLKTHALAGFLCEEKSMGPK
jgi:hypothetical protein